MPENDRTLDCVFLDVLAEFAEFGLRHRGKQIGRRMNRQNLAPGLG
jgi:hypothetical protein